MEDYKFGANFLFAFSGSSKKSLKNALVYWVACKNLRKSLILEINLSNHVSHGLAICWYHLKKGVWRGSFFRTQKVWKKALFLYRVDIYIEE